MFSHYFSALEDPAHPLLGPTLSGLLYIVSCPPNKKKLQVIQKTFYFFLILRIIFETIEFYFVRSNLAAALEHFSHVVFALFNILKISTFVIWKEDWMNVMNQVSSIEKYQLNQGDKQIKDVIKKYTKYSRSVTYWYWILLAISVTIFSFPRLLLYFFSLYVTKKINIEENPYPEIISIWVPFDKTKGYKYWIVTAYNICIVYYSTAAFGVYDSNVIVLMSFYVGQFAILKLNCERLFGINDLTINKEEIIKKIRECHHHHLVLVRNSKLLNSLLSPVMFTYIIICSAMMCCSVMLLHMDEATTMDKAWVAEYLSGQIFQLFLYCWHSQNVLDMSLKVDEAVYSSAWWSQDACISRHVILLAGQLNKSFVFTAGPFVDLNVTTFVAILKGAYSYYALLSNVEKTEVNK